MKYLKEIQQKEKFVVKEEDEKYRNNVG